MKDFSIKDNAVIFSGNLLERMKLVLQSPPSRLIAVDTETQCMHLVDNKHISKTYPVSTSRLGTGNAEGSFRTPRGIHRIASKIGEGAAEGTIFRNREDSGERWDGSQLGENLVLTRILRLEGLEEGINKGRGIDSFLRYIYIHGTNKPDCIGRPNSRGCVCMRNKDVMELFDSVLEGTIVVID